MTPQNPRYQRHVDNKGLLCMVVSMKNNLTQTCDAPLYDLQIITGQTRPDGITWTAMLTHNMAVQRGDLKPGNCVSLNQYESSYLGRLPHTKGKEELGEKYVGGTIGLDHTSGVIFVGHQPSIAGNRQHAREQEEEVQKIASTDLWRQSKEIPCEQWSL
jgi:hypothetical protein